MSIKEYQKARGIRSYDIHKEREEERKKKIKTPVKVKQEDQLKDPINLTTSVEAEIDRSFEVQSVAFKTVSNFSNQKTHRDSVGKISLNPDLVS